INEDGVLTVGFSVTDGNTAPSQITATATSGNTLMLPNANVTVTAQGGGAFQLTATPLADLNGPVFIYVTVSDGLTSTSQTFTLTVNPVNDPPSFTKGANQSVPPGIGLQTIANWATNISAGPYETGQSLTFIVGNDN